MLWYLEWKEMWPTLPVFLKGLRGYRIRMGIPAAPARVEKRTEGRHRLAF